MYKLLINLLFVIFLTSIFVPKVHSEVINEWKMTQSLSNKFANHISVLFDKYIYLVGGANTVSLSQQQKSEISNFGEITEWGYELNSPQIYYHSSVIHNNKIYLFGGNTYPPPNSTNNVYVGEINSYNFINLWMPATSLPKNLSAGSATKVDNIVYYSGGYTEINGGFDSANKNIYYSNLIDDSNNLFWDIAGEMPLGLWGHSMIEHNGHLLVIGGLNSSREFQNSVYSAPINDDGTIGDWIVLNALPNPVYQAYVTKVGSKLIVVGGDMGYGFSNRVYYADIYDDGTIGEWTESEHKLPFGIASGSGITTDKYLYIIGGYNPGLGYLSSVYYTKLNIDDVSEVPYYSQNDLPWGPAEYDSTQLLGVSDATMDRWGCAVTSAAMVLNYHGMNEFQDGTKLDPGTLNEWLKDNGGYISGKGKNGWYSYIVWNKISQLTRDLYDAQKAEYKLTYERLYPSDETTEIIDTDLSEIPPIMKVSNDQTSGHFIVAKNLNDGIYQINDPEWNYPTLTSFNDMYSQVDRFVPSLTDFSYITLYVNPEVDLLITDEQGRKTGIDEHGNEYKEIPNAQFTYEGPISNPDNLTEQEDLGTGLHMFMLPKPELGKYTVELSSNQNTPYTAHLITFEKDGDSTHHTWNGKLAQFSAIGNVIFYDDHASVAQEPRSVTYKSTIEDIRNAAKIKQIKNIGVSTSLIAIIKAAESSDKFGRDTIAKKNLQVAQKIIVQQRGKLIIEDAYKVIAFDLSILLSRL